MKTPKRLSTLVVLALLAVPAAAQIDLPDAGDRPRRVPPKPEQGSGDLAPHLVCTVCGTRNYSASRTRPSTEEGFYFAVCPFCREDRPHREGGQGSGADLDLPDQRETSKAPRESEQKRPAVPEVPLLPSTISQQARFILEEVAKSDSSNENLQTMALRSLAALGDDGVFAGRFALADDRAALIELGARVLLESGHGVEIERIATRLGDSLPGRIGPGLLDQLVAADPVHASPRLLCSLLEHPQGGMRQAATRHLEAHLGPELLVPLARALQSKRTTTRSEVIGLIAKIDDPASLDLMLEHLADSSPTVCGRVLDHLVRSEDELLDVELLRRAFSERWILRPSAYALLAVIDREDYSSRGILDERHAPSLLSGLESRDPLVVGACAAALAGIGFRSADSQVTSWVDDLVPAHLISSVSGVTFHSDYASLQPRALRRLELITGERIGTDGVKWVDWWTLHREGFHALRATFPVAPHEVSRMVVRHRSSRGAFAIAGFDAPAPEGPEERILLGADQMFGLVDWLREHGVLSAERVPGLRGRRSSNERELSLQVLGREKVFLFGEGESEEWFVDVEAFLMEQRERQRWQRFAPATSDYHSWKAEVNWWDSDQDEQARATRMKHHVLKHLQTMPPSQRLMGLSELERVMAKKGVGTVADIESLFGLIEEEAFYTGRCRRLIDLTRGLIAGDTEVTRRARERLIGILVENFGDVATESVAGLISDVDSDQRLALASDERPLVRALVALKFSESELLDERAALFTLLEDPDPTVEAAAVASLGSARVERAREELLPRAQYFEGVVRHAALEAIGRLGGEGVRQALVSGLAERDGDVQLASLKGLSHLGDPDSISLFISYLQQPEGSPLFDVALRGVERFGALAHEDLLRVARSRLHKARRPASFMLAGAGVGEVADSMVALLAEGPDPELALELAVLTCFDLRAAEDPAKEYIAWLRSERDRDAWRWFREATDRRELSCPPSSAFEGNGTREAALFLILVVERSEPYLAQRAQRELEHMLGAEMVELSLTTTGRETWVEEARALIDRIHVGSGGSE